MFCKCLAYINKSMPVFRGRIYTQQGNKLNFFIIKQKPAITILLLDFWILHKTLKNSICGHLQYIYSKYLKVSEKANLFFQCNCFKMKKIVDHNNKQSAVLYNL